MKKEQDMFPVSMALKLYRCGCWRKKDCRRIDWLKGRAPSTAQQHCTLCLLSGDDRPEEWRLRADTNSDGPAVSLRFK